MPTKAELIALYNDHAEARGDLKPLKSATPLTKVQLQRKLDAVTRQAASWSDMPRQTQQRLVTQTVMGAPGQYVRKGGKFTWRYD